MKNDIDILIYSYKGKYVKDTINKLKEYSFNVTLIDQHPLDRKDLFNSFIKEYRHIFWDIKDSPCEYKEDFINNSTAKYVMILSDNIFLDDNFIEKSIEYIDSNNCILSGFGKNKIEKIDLFSVKQIRKRSDEFTLTNFINRDFIIGKLEDLKKINYPSFLKYNGEEEYLSIMFFNNNINIYSVPSSMGSPGGERSIENIYTPFSLDHNYNEVIKIFTNEYCEMINGRISRDKVKDFSIFHNFDFTELKKLPYINNDVVYKQYDLNFFDVLGRKFVEKTRSIH